MKKTEKKVHIILKICTIIFYILFTAFLIYYIFIRYPDATVGLDFKYDSEENGYICVGQNVNYLKKSLDDLVIPQTYEGKPVVAIGDYAFAAKSSIDSVTIPASVIKIGEGAFSSCYYEDKNHNMYIKRIKFERKSQLKYIGDKAFYNCVRLQKISIPDSVEEIGDYAFACTVNEKTSFEKIEFGANSRLKILGDYVFWNNDGLKIAKLPGSLNQLGLRIFGGCDNLEEIEFNGDINRWYFLSMDTNNDEINVRCVNGFAEKKRV